ncbi:DUF2972 domain-containing protein [Campylobacter novaezeelandiae]|uniref:DUF2972 domain-containing protein n=1 Tax=Campylobacter novaezeelandiae TaxID=2267891 RepID=UPI001037BA3A|nr:DUF2972 domain-containing protein [Campylobacter novaezeelandiae]TBR78919.1 DUF2972 domain-containing protein [Campylobacter novaezeelandiae]
MNAILNNLGFVIKHFETIKEWLSSNEFKTRYKDENHPYPSLLDPNKLKDINEELNYHSIDANLAWELNLPLPDNYEFVFLTNGSCGHMSMFLYFKLCNIYRNWMANSEKDLYKIAFNIYNKSNTTYNIFSYQGSRIMPKLFSLVNKKTPLLVLVRDPIEMIKSFTNHIVKHILKFNLTYDYNKVLKNLYWNLQDSPSLDKIPTFIESYFKISSKINYFTKTNLKIFIDTKDLIGEKCFNTMCNLSKIFHFNHPIENQKDYFITPFVSKVMDMLPLVLIIHSKDFNNIFSKNKINIQNDESLFLSGGIEVIITFKKMAFYQNQENLIDVTNILLNKKYNIEEDILFLIKQQDYKKLKNYCHISSIRQYLNEFMECFSSKISEEKLKLYNANDILNYFKGNTLLRQKLKAILDEELTYIKQQRPDIVASWKYYQEFEKMCEELDGGS